MKATVTNPYPKGSQAAKKKMAKVRAGKKKSKSVVRKKTVKTKTVKKNPSEMRRAHNQLSLIRFELDKRKSVTVTFSKTDRSWINYILSKI